MIYTAYRQRERYEFQTKQPLGAKQVATKWAGLDSGVWETLIDDDPDFLFIKADVVLATVDAETIADYLDDFEAPMPNEMDYAYYFGDEDPEFDTCETVIFPDDLTHGDVHDHQTFAPIFEKAYLRVPWREEHTEAHRRRAEIPQKVYVPEKCAGCGRPVKSGVKSNGKPYKACSRCITKASQRYQQKLGTAYTPRTAIVKVQDGKRARYTPTQLKIIEQVREVCRIADRQDDETDFNVYVVRVFQSALEQTSVAGLTTLIGSYNGAIAKILAKIGIKASDSPHHRNQTTYKRVQALYAAGFALQEIVEKTGFSRTVVGRAIKRASKKKVCPWCHTEFEATFGQQRYCNVRCKETNYKQSNERAYRRQ